MFQFLPHQSFWVCYFFADLFTFIKFFIVCIIIKFLNHLHWILNCSKICIFSWILFETMIKAASLIQIGVNSQCFFNTTKFQVLMYRKIVTFQGESIRSRKFRTRMKIMALCRPVKSKVGMPFRKLIKRGGFGEIAIFFLSSWTLTC